MVQQNTGTEKNKSEHILLKEQPSASSIPPEEPRFCTKTSWLQLGYGLWAGLGSIIDWKTLCYVYGSFSLIMSVANTLLPDTPYFEILRGSLSQAKINLSKFRAANFDVDSEIKVLSEFRDENDIHSSVEF
ncbi:Sugar transporter ERD6-like 5 [Operophtera brumata]|uniref:Sugar transporter ERD6-like 5 n=1 Tax=Operophtera brumata TaxID=104452 RepID=A0A0L7LCH2_OPEBR|nr:Sugar transporter ERD6-like 5 [Operophtera brumata]